MNMHKIKPLMNSMAISQFVWQQLHLNKQMWHDLMESFSLSCRGWSEDRCHWWVCINLLSMSSCILLEITEWISALSCWNTHTHLAVLNITCLSLSAFSSCGWATPSPPWGHQINRRQKQERRSPQTNRKTWIPADPPDLMKLHLLSRAEGLSGLWGSLQ